MIAIYFKFSPSQFVKIIAFGLNYCGRVLSCKYDGRTQNYIVEYALDGKIETKEFFEDELE